MRKCSTLFFIILPLLTFAQFSESFGDGDFTSNPTWFGDTGVFIVNPSNELQLNDTIAGEAYLYTPVMIADSATWEFYALLDFSPSSSNFSRVYLSSDQPDLGGSLNGYFVKIGGESGTQDKLEIFKQEGLQTSSLISGTPGAVGTEPALARVRVSRGNNGLWELAADYTGGSNFSVEGTASDASFNTGDYIGVWCTYTTTRADKFFFDDFLIDPIFVDEEAPILLTASAINDTQIELTFNESLDQGSSETNSNYSITNGISVTQASLSGMDPSVVTLSVSPSLSNGVSYTVSVAGVEDLNSNAIPGADPQTASFTFVLIQDAGPEDLIMNELLPDPNPAIGLPDAEFVEIYNRTNFSIDLEGYTIVRTNLETGTVKTSTFPTRVIVPNQHMILTTTGNADLFEGLTDPENILGLTGFSDFLPNEDTSRIEIFNDSGTLLHAMIIYGGLYGSVDKNGRSLELANPEAICIGASNWLPSTDALGGTPGSVNSVFDLNFGTQSPALLSAEAISNLDLILQFDKSLNPLLAEEISAYELISGSTINPIAAVYMESSTSVQLTFNDPFSDGEAYIVRVLTPVSDCLGNAVDPNEASFNYVETVPAAVYDILINEIYPDPNPSNGLPEAEFIELFNRSEKNINLKDFLLSDRTNDILLPDFVFEAGTYLIVYENGAGNFGLYGDTLDLESFISLGNEEDDIKLVSAEGTIIHAVSYDISWYRNTTKDDGGWSLELINPNRPCEGSENWRAAADLPGGTPGSQNSILETSPDETMPDLIKAFPLSEQEIILYFSEALDVIEASNVTSYSIDNGIGNPDSAEPLEPLFNTVLLTLGSPIEAGQVYKVSVDDVRDCTGQPIGMMNEVKVALPEEINPGDLLINELLFNPVTGGVDFIELYNNSEKSFNLNDLIIANRDEDGAINQTEAVDVDCLIFPGDYMVLTENPIQVKDQYITTNPTGFLDTGLPTWTDKEGDAIIAIPEILGSVIIDEFHYSSDYHFALLDDENGVSLERISFEQPTQDPANWHSAAESVGFATPAYQNSQFFGSIDPGSDMFTLAEGTISPDGDGFQDVLILTYTADAPGYLTSIWIYDAKGRKVKTITENELLASEGIFQWDGTTSDGTKARLGIYVLFAETFDLSGNVSNVKKTFIVAGKL